MRGLPGGAGGTGSRGEHARGWCRGSTLVIGGRSMPAGTHTVRSEEDDAGKQKKIPAGYGDFTHT